MTEGNAVTLATASRQINQGARHCRGTGDGNGSGAHHGVVQFAHGQRSHQQVHILFTNLLAAGGSVALGFGDEGNLRGVLSRFRFFNVVDQAHVLGAVGTDRFKCLQRFLVFVDVTLQLGTGVTDIFCVDENGRNTGIDHGGRERSDAWDFKLINHIAGGEHGTLPVCRVHEVHFYFGGRKGYAVQFKITGFLHFTIGDGNVGNNGLLDIDLPDANNGNAVIGDTVSRNQTVIDGKGPDSCGQVATVAAPVHERLIDGNLAKQIIHIVISLFTFRQDH